MKSLAQLVDHPPVPAVMAEDEKQRNRLVALVLDDEESDRYRLIRHCRNAGLDLDYREAADLEEMRAILDEVRFDIVFIDYYLGMHTGQEALELVKADERQAGAVAIMVTSVDRHDVIIQAMRSGCHDYLIKEEMGVESIRKSVAAGFERKLRAEGEEIERMRIADLKERMEQFETSFASDMAQVMAGMLWRLRMPEHMHEFLDLADRNVSMAELCQKGLTLLGKGRVITRTLRDTSRED